MSSGIDTDSESSSESSGSRCQRCIEKDIKCSSLGMSIKKCASCIRYKARCIWNDTERRVLSPSTVGTLETTRIQNASSESGIMTRRRSKAAGENIPNIPELSSATASTSQNTRKSVRGGAKRTKTSDAPAIALSSGRSSTRLKRKRGRTVEETASSATVAAASACPETNGASDSLSLTFDGALALLDVLGFQFPPSISTDTQGPSASSRDPRAQALGFPLPQISALSQPQILENVYTWVENCRQNTPGPLSSEQHNFLLQWVTELLQEHDSMENKLCIALLGLLKT